MNVAHHHPLRRTGVLIAATALLASTTTALTPTASAAPQPIWDDSPTPAFYQTTQAQRGMKHGTLIRSQRVYGNPVLGSHRAYRTVFASRNTFNKPITGSAAVVLPTKVKAGTPIVVINDMINSLGRSCQPSFALDAKRGNVYTKQNERAYKEALGYLKRGWAVILPDFLGMNGEYGANIMSGRVILDAVDAATNSNIFGLRTSKAVLTGYSGGGMATMYAAAQQPFYSPRSHIIAAAAGGTPVDLPWMVGLFQKLGNIPNPAFGYATGVLIGMEREYGSHRMNVYGRMTPLGKSIVRKSRTLCHDEMLKLSENQTPKTMFGVTDLLSMQDLVKVGRENSLTYYRPIPTMPLFIYGAYTDIGVPLSLMQRVVIRYKKARPQLPIVFAPQIGPNHMDAFHQAQPLVQRWMADRFAGKPAPNTAIAFPEG